MRKLFKVVFIIIVMTSVLIGCNKLNIESDKKDISTKELTETNYFADQAKIDQSLLKEAQSGYTLENPLIIVNPYGNSPLTAVVIFTTPSEIGGNITVKGKAAEDDIKGSFSPQKEHIVPVYGLYAGTATKVMLTLEDGTTNTIKITTDKLDFNSEGFEVKMNDSASYDYSQLTFVCDFNGNVSALDSKGDLRWNYSKGGTLGVQALSNGHLAIPTSYTLKPLYYKSGILEMDLLGKVYHEYAIPGGQHHEVLELSNGNLLISSDRASFETVEDYIIELDRDTGKVVWELDLKDLIDSSEGGSINRTDTDWFHNNSLWYDEATDTLLISGRHVDAILGVDKSEKKLKWILGDPEGWSDKYRKFFFQPKGENFEWQYAQHQVSMLSNHDIMCFDNGAGRTKESKIDQKSTGKNVYSRAVVYRIDESNMTIEQVWEYGKELGGKFNSEWVSGAISLKNDPNDIWITSGANLYNPDQDDYDYGPEDMFTNGLVPSTNIVQVKNNKPVYQMKLNFLSYRSLRLSPYGDVGTYDVIAAGQYLGDLGVTDMVANIDADVTNAELLNDVKVSLDPIKLAYSTNYNIPSEDDLKDSYLVLRKTDGTMIIYDAQQSTKVNKEDFTVNVNGWVSTKGLSGSTYDVYLILGGKSYNTGYNIKP